MPENGTLVFNSDDKNVLALSEKSKAKKIAYGFGSYAEYRPEVAEVTNEYTVFRVFKRDQNLGHFKILLSGDYNILNATAVIAMCDQFGLDLISVAKALSLFGGVKRRQEILGEPGGVLVIEDFAHHPTAVRETVKGIRQRYKGRKIFSVFEPRSATSRRKVFQKDYVEAFLESDEILIAEAFDQTKIDAGERFSSAELVSDLKAKAKSAQVFSSADRIVEYLQAQARAGDLVLIMSNGGFDGIYEKLMKALKK